MKPITENEDFKYIRQYALPESVSGASAERAFFIGYDKGAAFAQTIIRKEHNAEMIEFAKWIAYCSFYEPDEGSDIWESVSTDRNNVTTSELLELFRKEREA